MDLTWPTADSTTLRALWPRVLTRMTQQFLALPSGEPGSLRHSAHDAARSIVTRAGSGAVIARALSEPVVSALLGSAVHDEADDANVTTSLDLHVLLALAALEGDARFEPFAVERPEQGWPALLHRPAGVCVDLRDEVTRVRFSPGMIEAATSSGALRVDLRPPAFHDRGAVRVTAAYVPIVGDVRFALADNNPLATVRLHPEHPGNALDLGGQPVETWVASLRDAFGLIEQFAPAIHAEMMQTLRVVVPVGFQPERHMSCSYEDALGAIYLTLHPSALKLAEALVHEFQHNKLHALLRLDPILLNARTSRHRSPVRPDPRPLEGVLLAVHAFIPVAKMYRAIMASGHPFSKGHDWASQCRAVEDVYVEGARTLFAYGQPTRTGAALFAEMRTLMDAMTMD